MSRRSFWFLIAAGWAMAAGVALAAPAAAEERPPNVVVVIADDLGYGDLGCYGAQGWETPHLDRMASEGVRLTSFYVAQAVCGASRAGLLSGCYPNRLGLLGAPNHRATHGVHPQETLIPEVLKARDYAAAMYGKWHLGHRREFLPRQHGFDDYFGLPYSNDMWPHHPTGGKGYPPLPLIAGDDVVALNPDQSQLTTWYTERAVRFIEQNKDRPFFLYVAHTMPHVPLYVSERFRGKSRQGLYGDVIQEIDWSVGQILAVLQRTGQDENTLVLFTSDNGPWLSYGNHAGSAGPLREGKGTTWDGGVRVPCIARWPGKIRAGRECAEPAATMDLLPTFARLANAPLPERKIDGRDIWPLLAGDPDARSPHEAYYFYWGAELQAVRAGKWKLHLPHEYRSLTGPAGKDGQPGGYTSQRCGLELYDLEADIGERRNVAAYHRDVVRRLESLADAIRRELGDSRTGAQGAGVREPGRI